MAKKPGYTIPGTGKLRNADLWTTNSTEWAINRVQITAGWLALSNDGSQYKNDIVEYIVWVVEVALGQVRQLCEPFHGEADRLKYVAHKTGQLLLKRVARHVKMLLGMMVACWKSLKHTQRVCTDNCCCCCCCDYYLFNVQC